MVTIERSGRVTLPAAARTAFRGCVSVRVSSRGEVAVLRGGGGGGGGGRLVTVDERGRLVVPCWLREAADPERVLLVGTGTAGDGAPVVLLAPPRLLLGGFAHAMVGER